MTVLRGIGGERASQLARLDIRTVEDLLLHRPRRYEDRTQVLPIAKVQLGEPAIVRGKIAALGLKRYSQRRKSVFEIILDDGTGRLHCRWWNLPYMQQYFQQGDEVVAYGKVISLRPRSIDHPETEVIEGGEESSVHIHRVVPIYPSTEGLPQRWLRSMIWRTLQTHLSQIEEPLAEEAAPDFLSRRRAVQMLHFPEQLPDAEKARRRLALDELIELQRNIQKRRQTLRSKSQGWPCGGNNQHIKPFLARLGFPLTHAQTKVLREIRQDLSGTHPMRRLLQGDVGSGKTVVAACSALMALESGFEVVLMAPTEILAEQHHHTFTRWLGPLGIPVQLRTGSHKSSGDASSGSADLKFGGDKGAAADSPARARQATPALTIGTHALLEESFAPERLGLVIIDEQHKFGVAQREQLVRKGQYPHLLVMTATPIPRTLGLTLYGDLDISVIDELPPGRGPVRTFVRTAEKRPQVCEFIRSKLAEGRQAYVVYPRVDDPGAGEIKAVTQGWEKLQKELAPHKVGLIHGRLAPDEKERVMAGFRDRTVAVLLATSVIEVGLDVPNATILLVENAEQFGLAQLHQLRGRVGRGCHTSYCILMAGKKTAPAEQRLQVLAETSDGFRIAEADLKLRGPGDLLGQQQSGLPPFRFSDLTEDYDLVIRAHELAAISSGAPANL